MKVELGAKNCLYPMPIVLVGTMVNGEVNYSTIAHVGVMDLCAISISVSKTYYTSTGIKQHGCFSINIPSTGQVKDAEYCGLVSGKKTNKGELFDNFYGKLAHAPMIRECPINMECTLMQTLDFPRHHVFIGEVVETYCDEQAITNGRLDFAKIQPILFVMDNTGYWKLGEQFAKAWNGEIVRHLE